MGSPERAIAAAGIGRDSMLSPWEEVKANHQRLESCKRHDFPTPETGSLGLRYTCRVCGGWADGHAIVWYMRGLAHGESVRG